MLPNNELACVYPASSVVELSNGGLVRQVNTCQVEPFDRLQPRPDEAFDSRTVKTSNNCLVGWPDNVEALSAELFYQPGPAPELCSPVLQDRPATAATAECLTADTAADPMPALWWVTDKQLPGIDPPVEQAPFTNNEPLLNLSKIDM